MKEKFSFFTLLVNDVLLWMAVDVQGYANFNRCTFIRPYSVRSGQTSLAFQGVCT